MLADPGETPSGTTVDSQFVIAVFSFPLKDIGKYLNLWLEGVSRDIERSPKRDAHPPSRWCSPRERWRPMGPVKA